MITKVYIHDGNGKQETWHEEMKSVMTSRGFGVQLFSAEELHKRQLSFTKNTAVVGNLLILKKVFELIGYQSNRTSYPLSLRNYLKRTIWETTLRKRLFCNRNWLIAPLNQLFI